MLTNKNIQIAMLEMSPQNKAILEFYFDRAGKNLYKVVNEHTAQVFIIDYDQPSAKQTVKDRLAKHHAPILLVSIKEQDLPSTIWLPKPLTANSLDVAAESLKELMAESENNAAKALEEEANAKALADEADAKVMEKQVADLAEKMEAKAIAEKATEEVAKTPLETLKDFDQIEELKETEDALADSNEFKASNLAGVGLALAGVGAVLTADDSSDAQDSLDNLNNLDAVDKIDDIENNEVDSLLDSLISDQDIPDQENEEQVAEIASDIDEQDIFLDSLESYTSHDPDLSLAPDTKETISDDSFDLLNSLDDDIDETELKSTELNDINFEVPTLEGTDLETSSGIDNNDFASTEIFESGEKPIDLEEDFTIHDDTPSTEEVYANTLEVGYETDEEESNLEKVSNELEGLNVGFYDETEKLENEESANIDETPSVGSLENDLFNFDAPTKEIEVVDTSLELEDELEMTLLDESGVDGDISLLETEDSNDSNLDSLLAEVSTEPDEIDVDNIDADLDNLLEEMTPVEESTAEIHVEANESALENTTDQDLDSLLESVDGESQETMDSDLQSLLNEVRQEANIPLSSNGIKGSQDTSAYDQTKAEKRWMQLCGNLQDIKGQKDVASISYDLDKHLLGTVLNQINSLKKNEQLYRLKYNDLIIVVDHMKNSIFCNMDLLSDEYSEICFNQLNLDTLKIHDLDYSEERLYRSKIEDDPKRAHSMESFIWSTSLLTSRGRLPDNTNITKKVALKMWPNLTRLELVPHAMHMAAVFSKHPGSLLEISGWLNIQQRYVFAFYNAALHLDMIELDSSKIKKSGATFNKKGSKKNSEERGFFGRLLKRLKT